MKTKLFSLVLIVLMLVFSCQPEEEIKPANDVSESALALIKALGFSTHNVQRLENAYLVEGDIVLHEDDLQRGKNKSILRVAQSEQYRTTNLVSSPRVIKISVAS